MAKKKNPKLPSYITVKKNKWHARKVYTINGKRKEIWRVCKIESVEFAELLIEKIDAEIELIKNPNLRSEQTLKEFFDYWFRVKVKKQNAIKTQEDYQSAFDLYCVPIANTAMNQIKPEEIQAICHSLQQKGYFRTAKKVHSLIRLIFNDAKRLNLFSGDNPANRMFPPQYTPPESECLTKKQAKRIIKAARKKNCEEIISFALETAMRPGEYFGLQWKYVDLKNRKVMVRQQVIHPDGGGFKFTVPKWKQTRNITISPKMVKKLKTLKAKQKNNTLGLVFPSQNNTPIRASNFSKRKFKAVLKQANLPTTLTPYCLRHTTATLLLLQKQPLKYVSSLLGHSTISQTAQIYSHYLPEMEDEISDSIAGMIY